MAAATDTDGFFASSSAWLDAHCTPPTALETPVAPLALASCSDCGEEGRIVVGHTWCRESGSHAERYRCCSTCRGLGAIAVEHEPASLADLAELDAAADAALDLSDREPGFVAAACGAVVDLFVGLSALLAAAVEGALEAHDREDERDGAAVARAGRDEPATTTTAAPVVELPLRAPARRAA